MNQPTMENITDLAKKRLVKLDKSFSKNVSSLFTKVMAWLVEVDSGLAPTSMGDDIFADDETNGLLRNEVMEGDGHENDNSHAPSNAAVASIVYKMQLVQKGIEFGHRATTLLNHYLTMHKNLMEPIPSSHLRSIEQLCSMAKSIERILRKSRRDCIVAIHGASLKLIASSIFKSFDLLRYALAHLVSVFKVEYSRGCAIVSSVDCLRIY